MTQNIKDKCNRRKSIKTLKCYLCEVKAKDGTFKAWMKALMSHYMQEHAEVTKGKCAITYEKKKNGINEWMAKNKTRFEKAK